MSDRNSSHHFLCQRVTALQSAEKCKECTEIIKGKNSRDSLDLSVSQIYLMHIIILSQSHHVSTNNVLCGAWSLEPRETRPRSVLQPDREDN